MNEKIIFIGGCGHGKETTNGVSAKNHFLLLRLQQLCQQVRLVDTDGWKTHPDILLRLILFLMIYRHHKIVISLNTPSAYKFVKVANCLFPHRHICYFVIGGVLADYLKTGKMPLEPFRCVNWFLVESYQMRNDMLKMEFDNVLRVPNFKTIPSVLCKSILSQKDSITRFVFLSRIIPEKGCDYIFDALNQLNREGWKDRLCVDFYGSIDKSYNKTFQQRLSETENASYKGFIDLRNLTNYATLASYHAMLFPTYWHGEGFPGIIIDAFIAGLPVIASEWGHNRELIDEGETGFIIATHDVQSLVDKMKFVVLNPKEVALMAEKCQNKSKEYDTKSVISRELVDRIFHT